jgi:splicing factor 3B subunit 5
MGDPFVRPGVGCETYNNLVLRHPGTGHSDTTAHEWLVHQHRDTLASLAGHADRTLHLTVAENVCFARMRHMLLEKLAGEPCGPAPQRAREQQQMRTADRGDVTSRAVAAAAEDPRNTLTAFDADLDDDVGMAPDLSAYANVPVLTAPMPAYGDAGGIGHM